jgi:hypothetical protein
MASDGRVSFSMRFHSSTRSCSTFCEEGMLGWWMWQAGSAQSFTTCPRAFAVHDDGVSHLVAWLLVSGELDAG